MASKLQVEQFKNEPRWHLEGRLINEGVHLVRVGKTSDGKVMELHGVVRFDGEEPPGTPIFVARFEGHGQAFETPVNTSTDEFRWPMKHELGGTGFSVSNPSTGQN